MNAQEAMIAVADAPIVAHESPLPDQAWSGLRTLALAVSTFALGRGWITNDVAILLTAAGGVLWPIVAGQLKIRRRAVELATVIAHPDTPNNVGVLRQP